MRNQRIKQTLALIAMMLTAALLLAACGKTPAAIGTGEDVSRNGSDASETGTAETDESTADDSSEINPANVDTESAPSQRPADDSSAAPSGTVQNVKTVKKLMNGITANKVASSSADNKFIKEESGFITKIFKAVTETSRGKNVLVSPLSVQLALAMTANGAAGETLSEMETLLGGEIPLSQLNKYLKGYIKTLKSGDKFKLDTANSIWFVDDDRLEVKKSFLQTNADYYKADAFKAPFDSGTLNAVNKWVEDHTDGMIDRIIDTIGPDDMMYLINAVAFDAEWKEKYAADDLYESIFTPYSGEYHQTEYMKSKESRYIDTGSAVGFIKPYAGGKYSFAALLPNLGTDVFDYVASLGEDGLTAAINSAKNETVIAHIPKFKYEYKLEMKGVLSQLGMPTAFDQFAADFSGIGRSQIGRLYIDDVIHKTFIELDEKGTKAAAVTAVIVKARQAANTSDMPKQVVLNRPFVYMIIDNDTSLPIFVGVLTDTAK